MCLTPKAFTPITIFALMHQFLCDLHVKIVSCPQNKGIQKILWSLSWCCSLLLIIAISTSECTVTLANVL